MLPQQDNTGDEPSCPESLLKEEETDLPSPLDIYVESPGLQQSLALVMHFIEELTEVDDIQEIEGHQLEDGSDKELTEQAVGSSLIFKKPETPSLEGKPFPEPTQTAKSRPTNH